MVNPPGEFSGGYPEPYGSYRPGHPKSSQSPKVTHSIRRYISLGRSLAVLSLDRAADVWKSPKRQTPVERQVIERSLVSPRSELPEDRNQKGKVQAPAAADGAQSGVAPVTAAAWGP